MAGKSPKSDARIAAALPAAVEAPVAVAQPRVANLAPKTLRAPKPPTAKPIPAAIAAAGPAAADPAAAEPVIAPELPTPAPAPAAAPLQKEVVMETITAATENSQAQAEAMFTDANDRAKSAMEKGSKMIAEFNEFSKGNIEAMVESSKIAAKAAEDVARYTSDYAKATVEKANAAARQLAAIKSPTELMKLQSDLTKEAVDSMMAETAKFTEHYLKLLGEIAQPMSNRVAVAAEKMKVAA